MMYLVENSRSSSKHEASTSSSGVVASSCAVEKSEGPLSLRPPIFRLSLLVPIWLATQRVLCAQVSSHAHAHRGTILAT